MKLTGPALNEVDAYDALILLTESPSPRLPFTPSEEALLPLKLGDYRANHGETILAYQARRPHRIIWSGARGDWPPLLVDRLRDAVGSGVRTARARGVKRAVIVAEEGLLEKAAPPERSVEWVEEQLLVAADMANYVYARRSRKPAQLEEVGLLDAGERVLRGAEAIAEGVRVARDFANAPPSEMNPEVVEEYARRLAEMHGLEVTVLDEEELRNLGMEALLAVGRGGSAPPRLVILAYRGGGEKIALVGKTVTFDSGGLVLKPRDSMLDMKFDKSGGGVVLGVVVAAKKLGLPVDVYALLPAAENMPDGNAYKLRDILRAYNGVAIEVLNTDAEGRLTLADALSYAARELNPSLVIDVATLTGAAVVALGNHASALFTNNDKLAVLYEKAAMLAGEPTWRLPMWPVYEKQIESNVADISNSGGRPAAAITAAKFLERFVEGKPWIHLDIAGVAWVQEKGPKRPFWENGATGWGVRSIIEMLRELTGRTGP